MCGSSTRWGLPRWLRQFCLQCGRLELDPGSGRSSGEGNDNQLQYSYLENSTNRGAWQTTVHGAAKSWTKLSDSRRREGAQGGFNLHLLTSNGVDICWIIEKARELQKNIYFCFIDYVKAFECVYHNKLWKILKEMGIPDHLTCLLRNLYARQEATLRTGHGTTDWFQIGKGVCQGCILSLCLFNLYAECIMKNAGLESRLLGEISITSDMQMTPLLWQKVKN